MKLTWPCWPAMRSATATPSSSALCASIGPRTTSPTAQTFGRLVLQSLVDHDEAALVEFQSDRFAIQADRCSARGRSTRSACRIRALCAAPLASSYSTVTSFLPALTAPIFTPRLIDRPCLANSLRGLLCNLLVDHAEEHRQGFQHRHFGTEATPDAAHFQADHAGADDAQFRFGTASMDKAPSFDRISFSSNGAPGNARGVEPVAITTCLAEMLLRQRALTVIS